MCDGYCSITRSNSRSLTQLILSDEGVHNYRRLQADRWTRCRQQDPTKWLNVQVKLQRQLPKVMNGLQKFVTTSKNQLKQSGCETAVPCKPYNVKHEKNEYTDDRQIGQVQIKRDKSTNSDYWKV